MMCERLFLQSAPCVRTVVMKMANDFKSSVLAMFQFHPVAVTNTMTKSSFSFVVRIHHLGESWQELVQEPEVRPAC